MQHKFAESERLVFYKPIEEDYDFLCEMLKEEIPSRNSKDPFTLEQIEAVINRTKKHWADYGYGTCVAKLKTTGERIGFGGAKHIPVEGEQIIDIGAIIKKNAQGKGYAMEGFKVFLEKAFHELGANKVATAISPLKKQVVHLVEAHGYRYVKDVDYELDGVQFETQRYYELTKEEWLAATMGRKL